MNKLLIAIVNLWSTNKTYYCQRGNEMDAEKIKIAILERLHKSVGVCSVCGRSDCGHKGTLLPNFLKTDDVLRAIDLDENYPDQDK